MGVPRPTCPGSRSPLAYPGVSFHRRAFQPRALSGRGLQLQVFQGGHFYQTRKSTASNTRPNRVCGLRNRKTPSAPGYLDQRHKACLFPVTQQTSRDAVTGKRNTSPPWRWGSVPKDDGPGRGYPLAGNSSWLRTHPRPLPCREGSRKQPGAGLSPARRRPLKTPTSATGNYMAPSGRPPRSMPAAPAAAAHRRAAAAVPTACPGPRRFRRRMTS